jgi:hypothetical protein
MWRPLRTPLDTLAALALGVSGICDAALNGRGQERRHWPVRTRVVETPCSWMQVIDSFGVVVG